MNRYRMAGFGWVSSYGFGRGLSSGFAGFGPAPCRNCNARICSTSRIGVSGAWIRFPGWGWPVYPRSAGCRHGSLAAETPGCDSG